MATDRLRIALASGQPLLERDLRQLDCIDRATDQMTAGFDALLRATRSDFGPAPTLSPVAVEPLLARICEANLPLAEAKGVRLRRVAAHCTVRSEREALSSIVNNFVGNAIKYTAPGGRVLLGCRRRSAEMLEIQVLDTGSGIPAAALDTIFEAFTRLDARQPGLGLGLSIAKRHAESLGHRLACRSVPGKGSCFSVQVPFAAPAQAERAAEAGA